MPGIVRFCRHIPIVAQRLCEDRRGNVAILFGLAIIPFAGLVGAAVDYSRSTELRGYMHRETDAAALAIASADSPNADGTLSVLKTRVAGHLGSGGDLVTNVSMTGTWSGSTIYTLSTQADLATSLAVVPGYPSKVSIGVTTTVKRKAPEFAWTLPKIKDLSYEAADYNRISMYCYDDSKKGEANKGRRLETLTPISDNGGTDYSKAKLPDCNVGETLSYQLRNVRNARLTPSNWDRMSAEHYLYFTDTTIDPNTRVMTNKVTGGRETSSGVISSIDLVASPILETIICTTDVDCKARSQGGILPNNQETGRSPKTAAGGCTEGKSMYYGWEDRPPSGGSDRDYDDIRIVVSCPTLEKISDKEVRIIR